MSKTYWTIAEYRKANGKLYRMAYKHSTYEAAVDDALGIHVNSSLLYIEVHNGNHKKVCRIYSK